MRQISYSYDEEDELKGYRCVRGVQMKELTRSLHPLTALPASVGGCISRNQCFIYDYPARLVHRGASNLLWVYVRILINLAVDISSI